METAQDLLKSAVYEYDNNTQMSKIISGIKLITDILPFPKKNKVLLEQRELTKYLILCSPIFQESINMIISSFIERFKYNYIFIENFWASLEFIATLSEKYISQSKDKNEKNHEDANNINIVQNEGKQQQYLKNILQMEFCDQILKSIQSIKIKGLDYSKILFENLMQMKNYEEINLGFLELYKIFLFHTDSEKVILQTIDAIEYLKRKYFSYFRKSSIFDLEIEEILISKRTKFLSSSTYSNQQQTQQENKKQQETNNQQDSTNQKSLKNIQTNQSIENDLDQKDAIVSLIENWLMNDEYPLIGKSQFMMEFFKVQDNFELFISFILEPMLFIISPKWNQLYSEFFNKNIPFKQMFVTSKKDGSISIKHMQAYVLRSYKTQTAICDMRNYRMILNQNSSLIKVFFEVLYEVLKREDICYNVNHISCIIAFFLNREPEIVMNNIWHYNILLKLVCHIEYKYIKYLLKLLLNSNTFIFTPPFDSELQEKMWRYCKYTDILIEMSKYMLLCDSNDLLRKFDTDFKPGYLFDMIQLNKEPSNYIHSVKQDFSLAPNYFIEEINGFKMDIDALKDFYKKNKIGTFSQSEISEERPSQNIPQKVKSPQNINNNIEDLANNKRIVNLNIEDAIDTNIQNEDISIMTTRGKTKNKNQSIDVAGVINSKLTKQLHVETNQYKIHNKDIHDNNSNGNNNNVNQSKEIKSYDIGISTENHSESLELYKLKTLYPSSLKFFKETELDKLAMDPKFSIPYIASKDFSVYPIAEFLCELIESAIQMSTTNPIKTLIGLKNKNYRILIQAVFKPQNCKFFDFILKNYLFKIKYTPISTLNSAYECGKLVNLILKNMCSAEYLKDYVQVLHKIAVQHVNYLGKTIVNSHAWTTDPTLKYYSNNVEPLGTARYMLVETLYLILSNDGINRYQALNEINESCWHVLITWFFKKKSNNMYQQLFTKIFDLLLKQAEEKLLILILFKLNAISEFHNSYYNACKNNVVLTNQHIDSQIYHIKLLANSINQLYLNRKEFKTLIGFINQSACWNEIKDILIIKNNQKSKANSDLNESKITRQKSREYQTFRSTSLLRQKTNSLAEGLVNARINQTLNTQLSQKNLKLPPLTKIDIKTSRIKTEKTLPIKTHTKILFKINKTQT